MKKASILILALCLLITGNTSGQSLPGKSAAEQVASQGVASQVQKHGGSNSYSVSAGGDLSLSVPVATVSGRELGLPLVLSYSAGIKVDQEASDVGLGWNLPLARITRDFGAFDPDYANVLDVESRPAHSNFAGGVPPGGSSSVVGINPMIHQQNNSYDGLASGENARDEYHVMLPNGDGGSFHLSGVAVGQWEWSEHENWRILSVQEEIESWQEWSRVNEVNCPRGVGYTEGQFKAGDGSYAAAIGIPAWAGPSSGRYSGKTVLNPDDGTQSLDDLLVLYPNLKKITYTDYTRFTLVDDNGVVYVFGKPLKAQRYLLPEDPFYSTLTERQKAELGGAGWPSISSTTTASLGEAWKLEYVAEWLLTEIHSADYVDANLNGIADDADLGDWIRIVYDRDDGDPLTCTGTEAEEVPVPYLTEAENIYPYYRAYQQYNQTDLATSCWRELAYVKEIISPVQRLEVAKQERLEVGHDYYSRIGNEAYQDEVTGWNLENDLALHFPNRLQRYTDFTLYDRVPGGAGTRISRTSLSYAALGSPEQLAVSRYLIQDNSGTEGVLSNSDAPYRATGRGKTTLLGVTYEGDGSSTESQSYSFRYGFNPDYTPVHRAKMWEELYFPTRRESYGTGKWQDANVLRLRNRNYFAALEPFLPTTSSNYHSDFELGAAISWPYTHDIKPMIGVVNTGSHSGIRKMLNETGYYHDPSLPDQGVSAWSLTGLTYPTGGKLLIEYEADRCDLSNRSTWQIKDDELENVQLPFNAHASAAYTMQKAVNDVPSEYSSKVITDPYHLPLQPYSFGVRVKKLVQDDGLGTQYPISFAYGNGVLHRPSADYWGVFLEGFQKHVRLQKARKVHEQVCDHVSGIPLSFFDSDFDLYDSRHASGCRIDNNLDHSVVYARIEEVQVDGGRKVRHFQTQADALYAPFNHVWALKNLDQITQDIYFITAEPVYGPGRLVKEEYWLAGSATPYATDTWTYVATALASGTLRLAPYNNSLPSTLNANIFTRHPLYRPVACPAPNVYYQWGLYNYPSVYQAYPALYASVYYYARLGRVAIELTERTSSYEGLNSKESYEYEPVKRLPRRKTSENSQQSSGVTEYATTETIYAWELNPAPSAGSAEHRFFVQCNMVNLPALVKVYGTDSRTGPFTDDKLLGATAYEYIPDHALSASGTAYRDGLRLYRSWAYSTHNVNPGEGWILGYSPFLFPNLAHTSVPANVPAWVEAGAVPTEWDDYGNVIRYDSPYMTGKVTYGYLGSVPVASFENTNGLDATYNGFEDLLTTAGDVKGSDGWQYFGVAASNDIAHTGKRSWDMTYATPFRYFPLASRHHFGGNATTAGPTGEVKYHAICWVYTTSPSTIRLELKDNSGTLLLTQDRSLGSGELNRWVAVEYAITANMAWGGMNLQFRKTSGSGNTYLDDIVVSPEGAHHGWQALNHQRAVVGEGSPNLDCSTATYDAMGRLRQVMDGEGNLISENRYHLGSDLSTESNYIETRTYRSSTRAELARVYLDGLGREKQAISWEPSVPRAIVTATYDYDFKGRLNRAWLPLPLTGVTAGLPDQWVPDYATRAASFYGPGRQYNETAYDASPHNKTMSETHPWLAVSGPSMVKYNYGTNDLAEAGYAKDHLLMMAVTDEVGNKTQEWLTKAGQVVKSRVPLDAGYTALKNGGVTFDAGVVRWAETLYEYDRAGRLVKVTNPLGQVTSYRYNSLGSLVSQTSPDKGTTDYRYDRYGRLRFTREATERSDNTYPDAAVSCLLGTCGKYEFIQYDRLGRPTHEGIVHYGNSTLFDDPSLANDPAYPVGNSHGVLFKVHVEHEYGALTAMSTPESRGQLVKQKVQYEHSYNPTLGVFIAGIPDQYTMSYDRQGRVSGQSYQLKGLVGTHALSYEYNLLGEPVRLNYQSSTSPITYFRLWEHDDYGRVTKARSGLSDATTGLSQLYTNAAYSYDGIGRMHRKGIGGTGISTDPYREYVELYHDLRSRVTRVASDRFTYALEYDARGNIAHARWWNAALDTDASVWHQYSYQYDMNNRLVAADYSLLKYTTTPPPSGSLKSASHWASGGIPLGDGVARLAAASDLASYGPHAMGEPVERNPSLEAIDLARNPAELAAFHQRWSGVDLTGFRPLSTTGGTDLLGTVLVNDSTWRDVNTLDLSARDWRNQAQSLLHLLEAGSAAELSLLVSEIPGTITAVEALGASATPGKTLYKVVATGGGAVGSATGMAVVVPSSRYDTWYWMDAVGNHERTLRRTWDGVAEDYQDIAYQYAAGKPHNRLEKVVGDYGSVYAYDANGNLTLDVANGLTGLSYDWRNRAVLVTGDETARYRYDAGGVRVCREVTDALGGVRREFFLGGIVVNELGELLRFPIDEGYATPGPGPSLKCHYQLTDWLGTPRVNFEATGTLAGGADYYPYGLPLGQRQLIVDPEGSRYQFTGHERDGENGLDYHGARWYNPMICRYLGVDELGGLLPGWSGYVYCLNDPVNCVDPDGRWPRKKEPEWKRNAEKFAKLKGKEIQYDRDGKGATVWVGQTAYGFNASNTGAELFAAGGDYYNRGEHLHGAKWIGYQIEQFTGRGAQEFGPSDDSPFTKAGKDMGAVLNEANPVGQVILLIAGREGPKTQTGVGHVVMIGVMVVSPGGKVSGAVKGAKYTRFAVHHIATNKHLTKYTPEFLKIVRKYGLSLEGSWNKMVVSKFYHYSKHPQQYHEMVLAGMKAADKAAKGNVDKFLKHYKRNVVNEILKDPNILNKTGW